MNNAWTQQLKNIQRGVTSLEVVIGVSIAGVILVYATYAVMEFINSARDITEKTEALYLAEEGLELVRFIRDESWSNISSLPLNTTRYLAVTSSSVSVTTTPEVIGNFTRSFRIEDVYRNSSNDDIVASTTGGSIGDDNSKYVDMTVSWGSGSSSVLLTTILTDIEP